MLNPIAFAQFAWDQVSIPDKAELELYDVNNCMWNLQGPLISMLIYSLQFSTYSMGETAISREQNETQSIEYCGNSRIQFWVTRTTS